MTRARGTHMCVPLVAAVALLGGPVPEVAAQQDLAPVEVAAIATPSWAAALEVVERPASPVVGVSIAVPAGSRVDPADRPGAGRVAAEAVVRELESLLGLGNLEGRVTIGPDRLGLTFLVRPDRLDELLEAFGQVAYGAGPRAEAVEAARRERAGVLRFEVDSPVREVAIERRALLYGQGDPRNSPPEGTLESIEALDDAQVQSVRRGLFTSGDARVVVVGPVDAGGARPGGGGPSVPHGTTSAGPAWSVTDRRVVNRNVTNTWISVAFPVPADLARVAVLYVADRMSQELNATPPDPGVFNVAVEVVETPEGELIVVHAAVLPESSAAFEQRIMQLPRDLALARDPAFFRFHRGRFRASRLVREAAPEEAAARMATELLTRGAILDFEDAVWTLDADGAADAAASLGPPRTLIFGPDLTGGRP